MEHGKGRLEFMRGGAAEAPSKRIHCELGDEHMFVKIGG
jgi:hypothetical protein